MMDDFIQKAFTRLLQNVKLSAQYGSYGASVKRTTNNQTINQHPITIVKKDLIDLWDKQKGLCAYLQVPMSLPDLFISHSPFAPSVDRIDNNEGYHVDNIILTTRLANRGRGRYASEDFKHRLIGLLKESKIFDNPSQQIVFYDSVSLYLCYNS